MPQNSTLETEVAALRQDMAAIKSLLIRLIGEDKEGRYRPEFVEEILQAAKEKPTEKFTDTASFLAELE